jgi:hypothetical protein
MDLPIKPASLSCQAFSKSCNADILARESSVDDINLGKQAGWQTSNIIPDWSRGNEVIVNVVEQNGLTISIIFTVRQGSNPLL